MGPDEVEMRAFGDDPETGSAHLSDDDDVSKRKVKGKKRPQ